MHARSLVLRPRKKKKKEKESYVVFDLVRDIFPASRSRELISLVSSLHERAILSIAFSAFLL